jgi:hypothetical protein
VVNQEDEMSSGEMAYLAMTVAAFVVFAVALMWVSASEHRRLH